MATARSAERAIDIGVLMVSPMNARRGRRCRQRTKRATSEAHEGGTRMRGSPWAGSNRLRSDPGRGRLRPARELECGGRKEGRPRRRWDARKQERLGPAPYPPRFSIRICSAISLPRVPKLRRGAWRPGLRSSHGLSPFADAWERSLSVSAQGTSGKRFPHSHFCKIQTIRRARSLRKASRGR